MKLIIEGTEEEIKRCLDKLAGEKVEVYPSYPQWPWPTYPAPYQPFWGTPRNPWDSPFTCTGSITAEDVVIEYPDIMVDSKVMAGLKTH